MTWIPPLLVVVPVLTGVLIAGGDHVTPQPIQKALGVAGAGATVVLAVVLALETQHRDVVVWFGGWRPRHGIAIGIDFAVDPFGAAMCVVIAVVVLLALVYSLTYMHQSARLFDALMLAALGAMCGFALAGDLFDMFVWLELMGVAAYALTGFKVDQLGPTQGAVNFAIVNSLAGYVFAIGIALLYARTGSLNLAQIGRTLSGEPVTGLTVVAMTLLFAALLTKGATLPFHLWAADAYAVAPAPVCAMLGGVMTDIGLIGIARLYWTVFDAPFGHEPAVGHLLLGAGIVSALVAGTMALLQRHLKRMLAYSVVSHIGVMLAGVGLLSAKGLAGTAMMFASHAFLTAALFLVAGAVLATQGSIDELVLRRRPLRDRVLAATWFVGAIGLCGAPYLGTYLGHGLVDEAASDSGRHWVQPLLWLAGALASAALLRAGARAFLGVGVTDAPLLGDELEEEPIERDVRLPLLKWTAVAALAIGLVTSLAPGLGQRAEVDAARFADRAGYAALVLHGRPLAAHAREPFAVRHTTLETAVYSAAATLLALGIALAGLRGVRLGAAAAPMRALKELHSGVVGDYVTWLLVGTAVMGGIWAAALH